MRKKDYGLCRNCAFRGYCSGRPYWRYVKSLNQWIKDCFYTKVELSSEEESEKVRAN